jgi:8-oxo-dGTP pyrophosphatase MutT (NUDIX family)
MKLHEQLRTYSPFDEKEKADKSACLNLLNAHGKFAFDRENMNGHFTASSLILNPDRDKTLLIHHRKLDKWIQPGGHCDNNPDTHMVARQEVMEEIGLSPDDFHTPERIFMVDIHKFTHPDVPTHHHYDVRYLSTLHRPVKFDKNDREVIALRWFDFDALEALSNYGRRMAQKFRSLAADWT